VRTICTFQSVCMCACVHVSMCPCVHVCLCTCVFVYIFVWVYRGSSTCLEEASHADTPHDETQNQEPPGPHQHVQGARAENGLHVGHRKGKEREGEGMQSERVSEQEEEAWPRLSNAGS
jgi:hypothetical protein